MKVGKLRQFYGLATDKVTEYLAKDLWLSLKEIQQAFMNITFEDNFKGWIEADLTIPAGKEIPISNRIKPAIPRHRVILRSSGSQIRDGDTAWDERNVYLHNDDSSDAIVTVAFLK
jgi:hypothetical protein